MDPSTGTGRAAPAAAPDGAARLAELSRQVDEAGKRVEMVAAAAVVAAAAATATAAPASDSFPAHVAWYVPGEMVHEKQSFVDLWLSAEGTAEALEAALEAFLREVAREAGIDLRDPDRSAYRIELDRVRSETVRTKARTLRAQLSSNSLRIKPAEAIERPIGGSEPAKWRWDVVPVDVGEVWVELNVWSVDAAGHETGKVFRRRVEVQARPAPPKPLGTRILDVLRTADDTLKLLGAGGLAAVVAFLLRRWRRKPQKPMPPGAQAEGG